MPTLEKTAPVNLRLDVYNRPRHCAAGEGTRLSTAPECGFFRVIQPDQKAKFRGRNFFFGWQAIASHLI
jgi:hypothetical protein